uniref:Zinc finger protein 292b n=1 Tax=Oryzias sinensis TaxID=183150 RepID=A0A8C7YN80_9TELE
FKHVQPEGGVPKSPKSRPRGPLSCWFPRNPALVAADYLDQFSIVLGSVVGWGLISVASCQTLLEFAGRWRIEEEPLPLLQVYMVGLLSYAQASPFLCLDCENVPLVFAHNQLHENGISQLSLLSAVGQYEGIWTHGVLQGLLSNHDLQKDQVEEFLLQEGPVLLQMRVKQLMKDKELAKAGQLAKACSESSVFSFQAWINNMFSFLQLSKEDCSDALEMICNLESDGDDSAAFSLCSAFLTRQLLQGDTYCAWELTLFWSKLLKRLEPSDQAFLDRCRQMSLLSKTAYHILFFIKVIQSEIGSSGLSASIELCIRALRIKSDDAKLKATVCKTISCLLSDDLEAKRACQLTEFLLEPTVDAYYAVETLYNEPDQKLEEENMPVPNSLRCELLLVLKIQWPFDPEFWDWKTLKRHCLALMGEEASIVSSIDSLNDPEETEEEKELMSFMDHNNIPEHIMGGMSELENMEGRKQKNREIKKLKDKGYMSARFRNWQVYMQYCVLCDKEFLGHRIVRHAQTHLINGTYSCPICAQPFSSKDTLIPHVTTHVKQSCKERLTAIKTNKNLNSRKVGLSSLSALKAKTQNNLHKSSHSSVRSVVVKNVAPSAVRMDVDINESNMCPVGNCRRSFKFFKNLISHVRLHGDDEEAKTFLELQSKKVVCQYCRRHFLSVNHLSDHLQAHCGVNPYICIQLNCKASYESYSELLAHRRTHTAFKAKCMFPTCGKVFTAAFRLYDHEALHYKTFTCKFAGCGKVFHSQQQLDIHLDRHATQVEEGKPEPSSEDVTREPAIAKHKSAIKEEPSQRTLNTKTAVDSNPRSLSPAMSQPLPPSATLHQATANEPSSSSESSAPPSLKERFHCAFGACTRHYCSYRSVVKHMKTTHSDFYEQWKVSKSNIRVTYVPASTTPSAGHLGPAPLLQKQQSGKVPAQGVQRENVIQSLPFNNKSTTFMNLLASLSQNQSSSALMENVLNPIVLSQLNNKNTAENQSAGQNWTPSAGTSQVQCVSEIQHKFERLDLVRDMSNQMVTHRSQNCPYPSGRTSFPKAKTQSPVLPTAAKPFACDAGSCDFSSLSSEALWKHLSKTHNYTREMVNMVKKRYGKYAPFKCQKCNKSFTRNSNLRAHYLSCHKLSVKEISDLDEKRRLAKAAEDLAFQSQIRAHQSTETEPVNKPTADKTKKSKARKPKQGDMIPYRPYSCVHHGCTAAFTIQQNLILHYRAVHHSALSALEINQALDKTDDMDEVTDISEFRCQLKDCCCVFQEVSTLFQHYLRLHKLSLGKICSLLSAIKLGRFVCSHQGCSESFLNSQKFISHMKEAHKDVNLGRTEHFNATFKCTFEGCDRAYATKSNMLRHAMKKHGRLPSPEPKQAQVKAKPIKPSSKTLRYPISKASNGKENIESNKKVLLRTRDVKRTVRSKSSHWTTYGKPSLKTKVEAAAMCTKKFPLQYPCMIKGCEFVTKAERSILKHYLVHGLSDKYLELHRSHFIFCKKFPKLRNRFIRSDDSKSDKNSDASDNEVAAEPMLEEGQQDDSKPILRRRTPVAITVPLFDKMPTKRRSERSLLLKRKRGRPRKYMEKTVKSKKILRTAKTEPVSKHEEPPVAQEMSERSAPLASFTPMGFEMSFLKFLEQSNKSEQTEQTKNRAKDISVRFSNPQKLKSLGKVRISLDAAFSGVTDPMLTQLQNMRPAVVLEKCN